MTAVLRDVELDDIEIFYTQEADPVANTMAAFPARDRTAHAAHWQKVLANDSNVARAIVEQGQVVGYIGSWDADGQRLGGYWIGRDHRGRGIPTRALADFVAEITAAATAAATRSPSPPPRASSRACCGCCSGANRTTPSVNPRGAPRNSAGSMSPPARRAGNS